MSSAASFGARKFHSVVRIALGEATRAGLGTPITGYAGVRCWRVPTEPEGGADASTRGGLVTNSSPATTFSPCSKAAIRSSRLLSLRAIAHPLLRPSQASDIEPHPRQLNRIAARRDGPSRFVGQR